MSIIRTRHDKTNPYVTVNRTAIDDNRLSWAAKGLWIYLIGRPDNWQVSVTHLSSIYEGRGGGRDAIYNCLDELIKFGYARRTELREKGKFKQYDFFVYEHPSLLMPSSGTFEPLTDLPYTAQPYTAQPTQTMTDVLTNTDMSKGNVGDDEKRMPSSKKESKTKFPLKKSQQPLFNWLKEQGTESDDDALMFYIRTFSEERIRQCIDFMERERKKGAKINRPGGFFRNCLEGRIVIQNSNTDENKAYAQGFVEANEWSTVIITEKYLRDQTTGDDLYFNISKEVFLPSIQKLYEKSELYK